MEGGGRQLFVRTYLYSNSFHELRGLLLAQAVVHHVAKAVFAVGVVAVWLIGRRKIRSYNLWVDNTYADTEERSLHQLSLLMMLMAVTALVSFVFNLVGRHVFVDSWLLAVPSILFSVLLFALGYEGSRQEYGYWEEKYMEEGGERRVEGDMLMREEGGERKVEGDVLMDDGGVMMEEGNVGEEEVCLEEEVRPEEGGMEEEVVAVQPKSKAQQLAVQIERLMDEQRLYLTSGLKVTDLAQLLNTNSRYIQQALNEELHTTFADYVNSRRVAFAQRLHREHPEMDVFEISHRSGFASSSSYYRNIKKEFKVKE